MYKNIYKTGEKKKTIKILLIFQRNEVKMEMRIEIKNEMIKRNEK